jgi:hypothetical protein
MRTEEEIERRVVFSDVEMTGRFASYVRKIVLEKLSYEAGGELDFGSLSHLMFGIIRVHAFFRSESSTTISNKGVGPGTIAGHKPRRKLRILTPTPLMKLLFQ